MLGRAACLGVVVLGPLVGPAVPVGAGSGAVLAVSFGAAVGVHPVGATGRGVVGRRGSVCTHPGAGAVFTVRAGAAVCVLLCGAAGLSVVDLARPRGGPAP